jgi:hypothetical protein
LWCQLRIWAFNPPWNFFRTKREYHSLFILNKATAAQIRAAHNLWAKAYKYYRAPRVLHFRSLRLYFRAALGLGEGGRLSGEVLQHLGG